ncbi:hypothetical protein F750_3235 [Streptomyces sp. PAMC 26508]|nr:hypothetical protein F750_3235 [Streptomyces sp. PAMC 26508]
MSSARVGRAHAGRRDRTAGPKVPKRAGFGPTGGDKAHRP